MTGNGWENMLMPARLSSLLRRRVLMLALPVRCAFAKPELKIISLFLALRRSNAFGGSLSKGLPRLYGLLMLLWCSVSHEMVAEPVEAPFRFAALRPSLA